MSIGRVSMAFGAVKCKRLGAWRFEPFLLLGVVPVIRVTDGDTRESKLVIHVFIL